MFATGIDHVAFNAGATFRALHDSLVNYAPEAMGVLECLHEEISIAIAHGFAKAAGRPMAAAVHDVVGLQHASMAMYNAWCDRVPMLVVGATGPVDATKRRPWIDWIHTANVQASQVRDYTKWDDQPASVGAMSESLIRGMQLTLSTPPAPVYICLDSTVQNAPIGAGLDVPSVSQFAMPSEPAPDPIAIDTLASWLVDAERPVVVADLVGRDERAFASLVRLAELIALPIVDGEGEYWKASLNFPTRHPLNLSGRPELLRDSDLVLGVDALDLAGTLSSVGVAAGRAPRSSRIATVSTSHLLVRAWASDYQRMQPADLHLTASAGAALPALEARVRALVGDGEHRDRFQRRRAHLGEMSSTDSRTWGRAAHEGNGETITWPLLSDCVDSATKRFDRVVANGHLGNWVHRLWDLDHPSQYLGGSGGGGLGYGLGASLGASLAHVEDDRLVIDLQTDGDALVTPEALWTAAHHQLPLLIVMDNNRAYNNSLRHQRAVASIRGRDPSKAHIGTVLQDPCVDFAALASSFGVRGLGPVTRADDLPAALDEAVRLVSDARVPVLVDVVTEQQAWRKT